MALFSADVDGGLFISNGGGLDSKLVNRYDDQSAALDWWISDDAAPGDLVNVYRYVNDDGKFAYSTDYGVIKKGKDYEIDTIFSPAFQAYGSDADGPSGSVRPVYELRHDNNQWVYTTQEDTIDALTGQGYTNNGSVFYANSGQWDLLVNFVGIDYEYGSTKSSTTPQYLYFGVKNNTYAADYIRQNLGGSVDSDSTGKMMFRDEDGNLIETMDMRPSAIPSFDPAFRDYDLYLAIDANNFIRSTTVVDEASSATLAFTQTYYSPENGNQGLSNYSFIEANIDLQDSKSEQERLGKLFESWSNPQLSKMSGFAAPNQWWQDQLFDMQGLTIQDKLSFIKLRNSGKIYDSYLAGSTFMPLAFKNGFVNRTDLSRSILGFQQDADLSFSDLSESTIDLGKKATQNLSLNGATLANARAVNMDDNNVFNATTWGADTKGFWADTDGKPHGSSIQLNNLTPKPYIVTTTSDQFGTNFKLLLEGDTVNVSGYSDDPLKFLMNSVIGEWLEWNLVLTVDALTVLGYVKPDIDAAVNYIYDYLRDDIRQIYTQADADVNTYIWDVSAMISSITDGTLEGFIPSAVGADNEALASHYIYINGTELTGNSIRDGFRYSDIGDPGVGGYMWNVDIIS